MISRLPGSMFNILHSTPQSAGKLNSASKTLFILAVLPALALLIACTDTVSDEPDVKSSDAKITELTLTISEQDIAITFDSAGQATVTVSYSSSEGKPTDALIKSMTLSAGASATDGSSLSTVVAGDRIGIRTASDAHDILLDITAEDGSESSYTITLNYVNSDAKITELTLTISEQDFAVPFDSTGQGTVTLVQSPSEDKPTKALIKSMTLSAGASATDGSTSSTVVAGDTVGIRTASDAHDILLNITAEDGSESSYTITLNYVNSDAEITALQLDVSGEVFDVTFGDDDTGTVSPAFSFASLPTVLTVKSITVSDGALVVDQNNNAIAVGSETTVDIKNEGGNRSIALTVTPQEGEARTFTVILDFQNSDNEIELLDITIAGQDETVTFDGNDRATITASLSFETLRATVLVKEIRLSENASATDQAGNEAATGKSVNIATSAGNRTITLTVTSQNGTARSYTITLELTNTDAKINNLELEIKGIKKTITFDADDEGSFAISQLRGQATAATVTALTISENASATDSGNAEVSANSMVPVTSDDDGDRFIITVTAEDGTTKDYTIQVTYTTPTNIHTISGYTQAVRSISFNGDGTRLASGGNNNSLKVWDMTGERPTLVNTLSGHGRNIKAVAFSPDGKRLASGGQDGAISSAAHVNVWNMEQTTPTSIKLEGHTGVVWSVAFNEAGTRLASGGSDKSIRIWNMEQTTPTSIHTLTEHGNYVNSVAFNKAGTRLASGSSDNFIMIWDLTKTTPTSIKLEGHTSVVRSVAFNEAGTRLASGSSDNSIRIWDMTKTTPTSIVELKGQQGYHTEIVYSVAFNEDGTRLASGSADNSIRIWDMTKTTPTSIKLEEHTATVYSVAFNEDGTKLASGSADNSIRIWE